MSLSSRTAFSVMRRPTSTPSTRRLSGSKATWSHWSPQHCSAWFRAGSQCFSFLPTKDHFSSTWSLVVEGGKARQFVVELAGVVAGAAGQAGDRVLADAGEACGLADAAAIGEVGQDSQGRVVGQLAAEQRRALTLGEAGLTGLAVQQSGLVWAVAHADGEVAVVAATMVGAVGMEATKAAEIVRQRRE